MSWDNTSRPAPRYDIDRATSPREGWDTERDDPTPLHPDEIEESRQSWAERNGHNR